MLPRPDHQVATFVNALADTTAGFFARRCVPGADLHACLTDPLGAHDGRFPDNGRPVEPASSSGDPLLDLRLLALRINPADDGAAAKGKLIQFVQADSWLSTELIARIDRGQDELLEDEEESGRRSRDAIIGDATTRTSI